MARIAKQASLLERLGELSRRRRQAAKKCKINSVASVLHSRESSNSRTTSGEIFVTQAIPILIAVLGGAVLAVQVGVNVQLRNSLGDPITSTFTSFVVGAVGLLVYAIVTRAQWPGTSSLSQVPTWQWAGGLLGAVYVVSTIMVGPRLGAATLLSLVVAGQMIAAMVLDHHGWLGFAQHAVNLWRIVGALLLIAGTVLILRN